MTRGEIFKDLQAIPTKNIQTLSSQITLSHKLKYLKQAIIESTDYLPDNCKFTERLYNIANNLDSRPLCKHCKEKQVNFTHFNRGYLECCSNKCSSDLLENREKIKQTNLERYGVENPFQNKEIKEKIKQINLKKFGVVHPAQNKEVKEKIKQTCLKKYGVENPFQNEEIKEKIKQSCLKKYGVENPSQNKEIKEKVSQTRLDNSFDFISTSKRIGKEYELLTSKEEYEENKKYVERRNL